MPTPSWQLQNDQIVQLIQFQLFAGQVGMNVFHYKVVDLPAPVPGQAALQDLLEWWDTNSDSRPLAQMADFQVESLSYNKCTAQVIFPIRYLGETRVNSVVLEGTYPDDPGMPPNISASLTLRAEAAGPHSKGRKQFWGIARDEVGSGIIANGYLTLIQEVGDVLINDITPPGFGGSYRPVIYNRALPAASLPIVSTLAQYTVRDQRTRTVGQGI